MSGHFWLTDAQMERLRPFFPKSRGKPRVDDRWVLSGSFTSRRTGCSGGTRLRPTARPRRVSQPLRPLVAHGRIRLDLHGTGAAGA